MSNQLLRKSKVVTSQIRQDLPEFRVGSLVAVHYKYQDGEKWRTQVFKGLVTNIHATKSTKYSKSMDSSFTVIKNSVNGIKVERTFPVNSPFIDKVEVLELRRARRSNLNNLTHSRKDYSKTGRFKPFKSILVDKVEDSKSTNISTKPKTDQEVSNPTEQTSKIPQEIITGTKAEQKSSENIKSDTKLETNKIDDPKE